MGKPLPTDEIIERANRGEVFRDDLPKGDDEETRIIQIGRFENEEPRKDKFFQTLKFRKKSEDKVYKSRRIENAKRKEFQKKLNLILLAVFVLVALLIYAIFKL